MFFMHIEQVCRSQLESHPFFFLLYGRDARLPTEAALTQPHTCYQEDIDDFKTDLVCNISEAWELARHNISQSQKKKKQHYDKGTKPKDYHVGVRVFVHMPGDVQGKAWKFARPFHSPYQILELTPTNASVRLVDKLKISLFLSPLIEFARV